MNVLVTGGTGYIGSHTVIQLIEEGHEVIIVDNMSNSSKIVLDRIQEITGVRVKFYKDDLVFLNQVDDIFVNNKIDSVIHFAVLKAVGESVKNH